MLADQGEHAHQLWAKALPGSGVQGGAGGGEKERSSGDETG